MNIAAFLELHRSPSENSSRPAVYLFQAKEYPLLFFSFLMKQFVGADLPYTFLSVVDGSLDTIKRHLETTFLGQTRRYWLGSLDQLNATRQKKIIAYCAQYQGDHTVAFFSTEKIPKSSSIISIDLDIEKISNVFCELTLFIPEAKKARWRTAVSVLKNYETMSLDQALMLVEYLQVIGAGKQEFVSQWLPRLVVHESSLFSLSQYFFARNPEKFYALWKTLFSEYSEPFWAVYWGEQLWRAHFYIALRSENNIAEAKKIAYRLPFSFIQRDWRQVTSKELQRAHQFIYETDWAVKNSQGSARFDLLFGKFFSQAF